MKPVAQSTTNRPGMRGEADIGGRAAGTDFFALGYDASYEIDLFGGVSRSIQAARADVEAAQWEVDAARVSVAAETARTYASSCSFARTLLTRDFEEAFKKVDAIVAPTSPTAAFKLGEKVDDPLAMYLADIYTVTANLAGIPGISVPCGETKQRLPIGMQIFGKHFDEATILRLAHAYETA